MNSLSTIRPLTTSPALDDDDDDDDDDEVVELFDWTAVSMSVNSSVLSCTIQTHPTHYTLCLEKHANFETV